MEILYSTIKQILVYKMLLDIFLLVAWCINSTYSSVSNKTLQALLNEQCRPFLFLCSEKGQPGWKMTKNFGASMLAYQRHQTTSLTYAQNKIGTHVFLKKIYISLSHVESEHYINLYNRYF